MGLGHAFEDLIDALGETHGEHLVGLVEDHGVDGVEHGGTSLHQVDEPARRSHDDIDALLQGAQLRHEIRAAIDGKDAHLRQVFGKTVEVVGNLQAELTCGREDDSLRLSRGRQLLEEWQAIGCGLARARLGQGHEVLAALELVRNHCFLHWHGCLEAEFGDGLQ